MSIFFQSKWDVPNDRRTLRLHRFLETAVEYSKKSGGVTTVHEDTLFGEAHKFARWATCQRQTRRV